MAKKRLLGKYDSRKLAWFRFAKLMALVVIITLIVFNFLIGTARVSGESMTPTLHNGQICFYTRLAHNYKHGDIVSIKMPSGEKYVKRVIAIEGDTIDISDGKVTVNGKVLDESYTKGETDKGIYDITYPYKVNPGMIYVMGDNREGSLDTRTFGPVVKSAVRGRILFH